MKKTSWLYFIHSYTSARVLIRFAMLYQQCFFNKLTCYLATPFHIVALTKVSDMGLLKGDALYNGIIQAVPGGLAPHVGWRSCICVCHCVFKFNASAAFLF